MLAHHSTSSPMRRYTNWWMRSSCARQAAALACTLVISSISDSLKSVVMCGCLSAEPSAAGCGVSASVPSGRTRRDSFSMPRFRPFSTAGRSARSRSSSLLEGVVTRGEAIRKGPGGLSPGLGAPAGGMVPEQPPREFAVPKPPGAQYGGEEGGPFCSCVPGASVFCLCVPAALSHGQRRDGEYESAQGAGLRLGRLFGRGRGDWDPGQRGLHAHRDPVGLSPVCGLRCHSLLSTPNLARTMPWTVKPGSRRVYSYLPCCSKEFHDLGKPTRASGDCHRHENPCQGVTPQRHLRFRVPHGASQLWLSDSWAGSGIPLRSICAAPAGARSMAIRLAYFVTR